MPVTYMEIETCKLPKMMKTNSTLLAACMGLLLVNTALAQGNKVLTIHAAEPIADVQPTMYGVFFEDINFGADGGIYAELIKNRSFEFAKPLMGWKVEQKPFNEGAVRVLNRQDAHAANPRFIRFKLNNNPPGVLSITNEGFRGMGIRQGLRYDFSCMYRQTSAGVVMHISLIDAAGKEIGKTTVTPAASGNDWHKANASFTATATDAKTQFKIEFSGSGTLDLDMISLFPSDTWKGRPGGMRADMIQLLADMKPGFLRFPGGCIVEGIDLSNRYQWKKTIGPIEERELKMNRWNVEFSHRLTPDYFQTFGLGFFEYFQLAEDIGATALPILNCGMACQYNTAELVPMEQLDPYVQDALDLVEFANGDITTTWGKVRADMGHPAPFHLQYLGIGNENWGPQYLERFAAFQKAIKTKYPAIQLVSSSGTDPDGERFDLLNNGLRDMGADVIDEHYYRRPDWFFQHANRYDNYPRNGTKIFAGEYAAHSDKTATIRDRNNWLTALSEAAFLTGLERNAGVVTMASYAPLFAHVDGWQWTPDLIWVDNLRSVGTTDYQVQKMYSLYKGTKVVSITMLGKAVAGQDSLYASAVIDERANELLIKIVNALPTAQTIALQLEGWGRMNPTVKQMLLQNDDLNAMNTLDNPTTVVPVESTITLTGKQPLFIAQPRSFTILRMRKSN